MRQLTTMTLLAGGLVAAVIPTSANAASALVIKLDPARSTVGFSLGATIHTVHGTARMVSGTATLDPASGELSGEVVVEAASTDTDNDGRDQKMHDKVLEIAAHPTIVLRPEHLTGSIPEAGEADVTLAASLELLGSSHAIEIPAHVARNGDEISVTATFQIPYVEWGLEDPSVFVLRVEKYVTVEVEVAGSARVAAPPDTVGNEIAQ